MLATQIDERTSESAVAHLRDTLGQPFLDRLTAALGGLDIKPPSARALHDTHYLVQKLGWDDATLLCGEVSNELLYIPSGGRGDADKWDDYFLRSYFRRKTTSQMAVEQKVSMRQVRRAAASRGWGADFRRVQAQRAPLAVWRERNQIIADVVAGDLSRAAAAETLDCDESVIACWTIIFREYGAIAQYVAAANSPECPPVVSNGGLTGLPSPDSTQEPDDAERAPAVTYG